MIAILQYLWALPNTLIGLSIGLGGIITGGRVLRSGAVLEFYGGFVTWLMKRVLRKGIIAMTLGYTIIALTREDLDAAREHEMVHVAQTGRWGPLFIPVYLLSSLHQWWLGNRAYRDNVFEREAYAKAPIRRPGKPSDKTE